MGSLDLWMPWGAGAVITLDYLSWPESPGIVDPQKFCTQEASGKLHE